MGAPIGQLTRGTTGYNRLRRSDRWLVHSRRVRIALQAATDPLVVDLGYGALPVTTLELAARLRAVRADVRVVGLEIHPDRVAPSRDGVEFGLGGFELAGRTTGFGARLQRAAPVSGRGGARRVGGDAGGAGAGRADRRRHVRRVGPPVLLGAARRRRPDQPDAGVRSVRDRAPVGSGRTAAEGADPPQRRRPTHPHAARRRRTARGPASRATVCSGRGCAGGRCWSYCAPRGSRSSRRADGCATVFCRCRGR